MEKGPPRLSLLIYAVCNSSIIGSNCKFANDEPKGREGEAYPWNKGIWGLFVGVGGGGGESLTGNVTFCNFTNKTTCVFQPPHVPR